MRTESFVASSLLFLIVVAARSAGAQPPPKRIGSGAPPAPTITRSSVPPVPAPPSPVPPVITTPRPATTTTPPATTAMPSAVLPGPGLSPFAADPSTYAPHYATRFPARPRRHRSFQSFSPDYGYALPFTAAAPAPSSEAGGVSVEAPDSSGILLLDVEPRIAQIYVDGFYIGTVEDFERTGVPLSAGRHRVEVRAAGYETLTIPVEIAARSDGQPTRFRGVLMSLGTEVARSVPAPRAEAIYVIPGCYAGNRPPAESALAQGCDISRLRVLH